jgi:hypothetical protein
MRGDVGAAVKSSGIAGVGQVARSSKGKPSGLSFGRAEHRQAGREVVFGMR